jgi:hypothetical protein
MADRRKTRPLKLNPDGEFDEPLPVPDRSADAPDFYEKDKERSSFRPPLPEYHFSVAMPINLALLALDLSAYRFNATRADGLRVQFEQTRLNDDRARFVLSARRGGLNTARIVGSMERWEGDHTRIDADVGPGVHPLSRVAITLLGFGLAYMVLIWLLRAGGPLHPVLRTSVAIVMIVTLLAAAFMGVTTNHNNRRQNTRAPGPSQADLDMDTLSELLAETFRVHDVQWIEKRR